MATQLELASVYFTMVLVVVVVGCMVAPLLHGITAGTLITKLVNLTKSIHLTTPIHPLPLPGHHAAALWPLGSL